MAFELDKLVRPNIKTLKPYSSAKDEYTGDAKILLDANENSLGSPLTKWYNRYPDPYQQKLKDKLAFVKQIAANQIFIGNGSDECIDILFRTFCEPGKDNIIICPPTYPMYEVSANINDIAIQKAPLLSDYQLNLAHIEQLVNPNTKIIWICSPNNPTGNSLDRIDIETILNHFNGIVVVDEAYQEYAQGASAISLLDAQRNVVVLRTLSKAHALAAARIGAVIADPALIQVLQRCQAPYPLPEPSVDLASRALTPEVLAETARRVAITCEERVRLAEALSGMAGVRRVYPSSANFLLVRFDNPEAAYKALLAAGIVVRDMRHALGLGDALRISLGTREQNDAVLATLAGPEAVA